MVVPSVCRLLFHRAHGGDWHARILNYVFVSHKHVENRPTFLKIFRSRAVTDSETRSNFHPAT
jgi:hypothetical protein